MNGFFDCTGRSSFALLLLAAMGFHGLVTGQTPHRTKITDRKDVLPKEVAQSLDLGIISNVINRNLKGQVPIFVPIYVLVNPALLNKSPALTPSGKTGLSPEVIEALAVDRGEGPAHYSCLKENATQFFQVFFPNQIRPATSLIELIRDPTYQWNEYICACFDAQCWAETVEKKVFIVVRLSLRLFRITADRKNENFPYSVTKTEMLFSDHALGRSGLDILSPDPEIKTKQCWDAFQAATIDALDGKVAVSLFLNPRMMEANWVTGVRKEILNPTPPDSGPM